MCYDETATKWMTPFDDTIINTSVLLIWGNRVITNYERPGVGTSTRNKKLRGEFYGERDFILKITWDCNNIIHIYWWHRFCKLATNPLTNLWLTFLILAELANNSFSMLFNGNGLINEKINFSIFIWINSYLVTQV